ncbi:MAG: 1-(5-phosphoribosyl)-5-[(5-phosphoribosylamino)methylideneamino]imidazole-4-carboxamide isomerase [Alphaproteobacteria bacterium]|nr:1-(5-phosphoribosyl)-5-[(5-phosphoribosylamino)methylideneamino]imidazole-4-carboxamide isomerase [Alphaproteobacteria bacterium]MBV9692094.1 1-(5-phosphoribosyl)-5-[(5-phosphoribosylamino)methylideneamino]imidazole-4-carboxamide isomerase [Alphaproteobacteria bacterium]
MILYPAIDLKNGHCVRLARGEMASATVYNPDPVAQALAFERLGFSWLHCVDLDGAFAGRSANAGAVQAIRAATKLPIQLGGGIRDLAAIEWWLSRGIARVILGTAALKSPALVAEAARRFPGRIVVGADTRAGKVAVEGWGEASEVTPVELGRRFEDLGVAALLFTDVEKDGLLGGVNVAATRALAEAVPLPVIASGGVGGIEDIEALVAADVPNIEGVVIGRALYDGRIDAVSALEVANGVRSAKPAP